MTRLILLCGLPGSGKTTLAKQLERDLGAVRLCPDDWLSALGVDLFDEPFRARLEQALITHAGELLRRGVSVVLEFGFWSRAERDGMRAFGRELGVEVELRYLAVPFEELVRRVEARPCVPLTRAHLTEYRDLFEAPTPDELALFDLPPTDRSR